MRALAVSAVIAIVTMTSSASSSQGGGSSHTVTKADLARWEKELSNWGRWGKADQIGTLNLITPAKRKQAAALVKEGVSISLAVDANTQKELDNPHPYEHKMLGVGSDSIGVEFHGWANTHLDSLGHIFNAEGKGFNDYLPDKDAVMKNGHPKNSIHNVKNGIFTRGILMDIPRLKGVPYLEPGTPIYAEDLDAWEKKAGVKVSAGDALLVRTGRWSARKVIGPFIIGRTGKAAGLDPSVLPWLKKRDIAVLGGDGAQAVAPSPFPGAMHDLSMTVLGIHVLDDADFEALAEAAAARNRWEFLLTIQPLPIRGGTGSPVNPVATF